MRNLKRISVWVPALGILAFAPSGTYAYTLSQGATVGSVISGWNSSAVSYDYNLANCGATVDPAVLTGATDTALSAWNGVPSSTLALGRGVAVTTTPTAALAQTTTGNPLIVCDTAFSADTGLDGNAVPAANKIISVDGGNHVVFSVLFLNAESGKLANIKNVPVSLLSTIMAHEIGHSLGLGHSSSTNALMYYDATAKTQLGLSKDDVDAITFLYPRDELSGSKVFGCGSLALVGGRPGSKGSRSSDDSFTLMAEFTVLLGFCWMAKRLMAAGSLT